MALSAGARLILKGIRIASKQGDVAHPLIQSVIRHPKWLRWASGDAETVRVGKAIEKLMENTLLQGPRVSGRARGRGLINVAEDSDDYRELVNSMLATGSKKRDAVAASKWITIDMASDAEEILSDLAGAYLRSN